MVLYLKFPCITGKQYNIKFQGEIKSVCCLRSLMYFKSMKIKYFSTIIFLFFFGLVIGCGNNGDTKDDTYIIATDATLPPMSFMSVGNDMIGFEPDLIRAIADKAGFNIRLVNVEWAGLFG
ncbi:MAG TPA: hypothetical protein DE038_01865, partial [Nitrospina sp.]|nr:hypothetical protein [Nitrospina sp.]